jgi:hypothetical protein
VSSRGTAARRRLTETKSFAKTSEFFVWALAVAATTVATYATDSDSLSLDRAGCTSRSCQPPICCRVDWPRPGVTSPTTKPQRPLVIAQQHRTERDRHGRRSLFRVGLDGSVTEEAPGVGDRPSGRNRSEVDPDKAAKKS